MLAPTLTALVLLAAGCRDRLPFEPEVSTGPAADLLSLLGAEEEDSVPADFRLTGGGRIDGHDHEAGEEAGKSPPGSHDFATFGFQARPTAPDTTSGSGQITWVEHNPAATIYGAFTFHGQVTHFSRSTDETEEDSDCGRFRGEGVVRTRTMVTFNAEFTLKHACDKGEPGRWDHIKMKIEIYAGSAEFMSEDNDGKYERHGLLTGGNVQKHGL